MSFNPKINTEYSLFDIYNSIWESDKSKHVLVMTSEECYGEFSRFKVLDDLDEVAKDIVRFSENNEITLDSDIEYNKDNSIVQFYVFHKGGFNERWAIFGVDSAVRLMLEFYRTDDN